ncbi:MAG: ectonucleotide pyrophosphatase/phosphodiesterase [Pseudomonadota bacterium]
MTLKPAALVPHFLIPFLLLPALLSAAGSGGINAPDQRDKPYLILISIDGLGWDARGRTDTPALDSLAERGVVARSMQPVWPSLTFPNHYSIATGLYPSQHGLVGNHFASADRQGWYTTGNRDEVENPVWYAGEPIWVSAEKAGMVSAAYFFVGTEAPVQGIQPSHFFLFDSSVTGQRRVEQAIEWLSLPEDRRPHMIALYFEHVDEASHDHGPSAPETAAVIRQVDNYIATLLEGIEELPFGDEVYVIVVADHGQSAYLAPDEAYVLSEHVDIGEARIVQGGNYVLLYYDDPDAAAIDELVSGINRTWEHGRAYARAETPRHWRVTDDGRYPDVFIQAELGHAVITDEASRGAIHEGAHGWPPDSVGMGASFIAAGGRLPRGVEIGEIHVVDVYPLMLEILELPTPQGYEAEPSELGGILLSE